jgi:AcrR family transcriptional regulator
MDDSQALAAKDPEERRRRIVAAAIDVIVERGVAGTRVGDIAKRAGTSSGLVMYHFGSLDGVLAEAVHSVEDDFFARFAAAVPEDAGAVERLRVTGELAADVDNLETWRLWLELWVRSLRDERTREQQAAFDAAFRDHLLDTLRRGVDEGALHCQDPEAAATRLAALLDGLAVRVSLGDPHVPAERMVGLWLGAVAAETGLPDLRPPGHADAG